MEVSRVIETMETEEDLLTCLRVKLYHPQQGSKGPYRLLPLGSHKQPAEDPLRLGRDGQACTFALADTRVSRKQLAFQAYRCGPEMLFSVQNLSQRGQVTVSGSVLGYLERTDLQDKALIQFGAYEMLVVREPGEAIGSFEVKFEVLTVPPSREMGVDVPSIVPIMDTGSCHHVTDCFPSDLRSRGPLETDETLMCPK